MAVRARMRMLVSGRVQGVGFRWATVAEATRLGLGGWVRNLPSGAVEILAEGDKDSLSEFGAWARQGPSFAEVSGVEEEWLEYRGEFGGFRIR
jgi:acylphosphatase